MRVYVVMLDGVLHGEFTSLAEAVREATMVETTDVISLDRPEASASRRYSMSRNPPPADYRWIHQEIGEQDGDGVAAAKDVAYSFRAAKKLLAELLDPKDSHKTWDMLNDKERAKYTNRFRARHGLDPLPQTANTWRRLRREWLRQFPVTVNTAPVRILDQQTRRPIEYRYWRWIDPNTREVVYWERRLWSDPLPVEAGFWPA